MDDDALIELILAGMGIKSDNPQFATYKAALKSQAAANSAQQGVWFGEDTRRFDVGQQREKDKIAQDRYATDQQYNAAKLAAKTASERLALDDWKAKKDAELRAREIAVTEGQLDVNRGAQGLDLLKTDVSLRQDPRSWAALADWESGVAASPAAPAFLQALLKNSGASAGSNAPTMVAHDYLPQQNSLAATLGSMGVGQAASDQTNALMSGGAAATPAGSAPSNSALGAGATTGGAKPEETPQMTAIKAMLNKHQFSDTAGWNPKDSAMLTSIAALAAQGSGKVASRYSMLDPNDQDLIRGGLARLGMDPGQWDRNIDRQRVGNSASGAAA